MKNFEKIKSYLSELKSYDLIQDIKTNYLQEKYAFTFLASNNISIEGSPLNWGNSSLNLQEGLIENPFASKLKNKGGLFIGILNNPIATRNHFKSRDLSMTEIFSDKTPSNILLLVSSVGGTLEADCLREGVISYFPQKQDLSGMISFSRRLTRIGFCFKDLNFFRNFIDSWAESEKKKKNKITIFMDRRQKNPFVKTKDVKSLDELELLSTSPFERILHYETYYNSLRFDSRYLKEIKKNDYNTEQYFMHKKCMEDWKNEEFSEVPSEREYLEALKQYGETQSKIKKLYQGKTIIVINPGEKYLNAVKLISNILESSSITFRKGEKMVIAIGEEASIKELI